MAGHKPWREIKHKNDTERTERTERTEQGFEVPVPKRGVFFLNLKKIAKKPSATRRSQRPQK